MKITKPLSHLALAINMLLLAPLAHATSFTIINGVTENTPQTLIDNESGTIEAGGTLSTGATSAVTASGVNNIIDNSGSIDTTGVNARGIHSSGADASIDNSGSINTTGDTAFGILSDGADTTINNSGSINTMGLGANGIYSTGAATIINNSRSITTVGIGANGIISTGEDITINNNGSINTTGDSASGIFSNNINASISNSGSINTIDINARGIFSSGADATINNSGSINTTGDTAHGILSDGADATISSSGSITTTGDTAHGINSSNINAIINNSGSINTIDDGANGILSDGADTTINNSGSINTTGLTANGIYSTGASTIINNSRSITTVGQAANGIISTGVDITINNNGSIKTTGENASGIFSNNINASISNSGSINIMGVNARGIFSSGADATINNSGLISVANASSFAVLGGSNDITLNLLSGSIIMGAIDLGDNGGDNDTVNIYGGSASATLSFTNVENINLLGSAGVISGNTVTTIDTTGESTRGVALARLSSSIHNMIHQRMTQSTPLKPVQVAALTLSHDMLFQERKPVAWAQVFGGTFDRDSEGTALAYNYDQAGFTIGYEWDVSSSRVGLISGVAHTKTETDTTSFETEADNYYIGTYGHFNLGRVNLSTSFLGGYRDHDNDRLVVDNINGLEVAESDFDSTFLSPSVTLSSVYSVADKLELRPSINATYSVAWLDNYRESGTTNSNLQIDSRTVEALTARIQLAAAYQLDQSSEFEFRVGVNSRHTDDDDTKGSLANSDFRFANAGDENVTGGYAGVNLRVVQQDNLSLTADVEFGGDSDEDYVNANISLEYSF